MVTETFMLHLFLILDSCLTVTHFILHLLHTAVNNLEEKTLDKLDELEDEEDERILEEYRRRRIAEMMELANRSKYGEVREISAEDYVQEVNNAGEDVWVVLHLYKSG